MNLDVDLTREQIIEIISAIMTLERERLYGIKHPRKTYAVLERLSFELHKAIEPTKEEWSKTDYFNQYFSAKEKEQYLSSVR